MRQFKSYPTRRRVTNAILAKYLPRWQMNSSPNDLGFLRFCFDMFPDTFDKRFGVPDWVRPTFYQILKYHTGITKIERAWAIVVPRDFAKSTYAKGLVLYLQLVGYYGIYWADEKGNAWMLPEADYIRIRGKNKDKAEEKLNNIVMEYGNEKVIKLFGNLQPTLKDIKDKKLKNQGKLMILKNHYVVQAQGLAQASRGANIRDRRPKVDINDDPEDPKNTLTERLRKKNADEVLGDQFGGLVKDGLTIMIGNFVHEDGMLTHMAKKDSGWNFIFYQATMPDSKGVERSLWERRYPTQYIHNLGEWYKKQPKLGGWATFRREYYNEIISDKEYQILEYEGKAERYKDENYLVMPEGRLRVWTVVSGDPAISTQRGSSDGVVTVTMFGSDGFRYVHETSLAKFDIRDRFYDDEKRPHILAQSTEEMMNIKRTGLVDEMARKIIRYKADAWVLENAGQQLAWYNDLKELLQRLGYDGVPGLPYHPTDEKDYKLETGLLNYVAAGRYKFNRRMQYYDATISQITTFPNNKKDILDALHNAEKMGKVPEQPKFNVMGDARFEKREDDSYAPPKDVEEAWVVLC